VRAIEKLKPYLKNFGSGGNEVYGALQIVNNILKSTLSPIKLESLHYLIDFIVVKDIFTANEKEDFR